MTALNKQALRVPERKRHDWSQAVMRDCDFCSQWSLTVHHEDGGCICASCCDAEYTSGLKGALEYAIDRAEAAEKRIAELEARTVTHDVGVMNIGNRYCEDFLVAWTVSGKSLPPGIYYLDARHAGDIPAGIGVKGE